MIILKSIFFFKLHLLKKCCHCLNKLNIQNLAWKAVLKCLAVSQLQVGLLGSYAIWGSWRHRTGRSSVPIHPTSNTICWTNTTKLSFCASWMFIKCQKINVLLCGDCLFFFKSRCPLSSWFCDKASFFPSPTPFLFLSLCQEHSVHWTFACPVWKTSAQSTFIRRCGGCAHRGLLASRPGTSTTSATRQLSSTPSAMGNSVRCSGLTQTWTRTVSETRTAETNRTEQKAVKMADPSHGSGAEGDCDSSAKRDKGQMLHFWPVTLRRGLEGRCAGRSHPGKRRGVRVLLHGGSERASCPANLQFFPFWNQWTIRGLCLPLICLVDKRGVRVDL